MRAFALRALCYLLVVAACFQLAAMAMQAWGWEMVLREHGLLEWAEVGALLVATGLAIALACQGPRARGFYVLLVVLFVAAEFREFDDSAFYLAIPGPLRWLTFILALGVAMLSDPRGIVTTAYHLLDRPHSILLLFGAVIALLWAQLLGQPAFWVPLYRDYGRGRRVVEESLELAGWLLVAIALLEEYVRVRRAARRAGASDGIRALVLLVAIAGGGCGGDAATDRTPTMMHDQTPHHGGVVALAGALHVEAAAAPGGEIRFWLTDEAREDVPLLGASGSVHLELPDGTRRTLPLTVRDGALIAAGPPLVGDDVVVRLELRRDARPIDLTFVLPLVGNRPGAGGVPAAGCAPVAPRPDGGRTPRCTATFPHGVLAIAAPPDGTLLLVSEAEGGVSAWRMPDARVAFGLAPPPPAEVPVVEGGEPDVGAAVIALAGNGVDAVLAIGPRLVRYELSDGRVVRELPSQRGRVRDIAWSPAGDRLLVSLQGDADAELLDVETGRSVRRLGVSSEAAAVAFAAGGEAVVGSEVGPITVFDPGPRVLADVLQPVETLGVAGDRVAWAGADRSLRVWGLHDGAERLRVELAAPAVRLAVAPAGDVVAVSLRGGPVELRALEDGRLLETLRWHAALVRALAWAGPVLVTGDTDGTLAVWDPAAPSAGG